MPASHRSRRSRLGRGSRVALASGATLLALGATLGAASTASAVGSSACTSAWYDISGHINTSGVNLRSGPGTSYVSKGLLAKGTSVHVYCYRSGGSYSWHYLKVTSGANSGVRGWVRGDLVDWW